MTRVCHGRHIFGLFSPPASVSSRFIRLPRFPRARLFCLMLIIIVAIFDRVPGFGNTQDLTKPSHTERQRSRGSMGSPLDDLAIGPDQASGAVKGETPSSRTVSVIHRPIEKSLRHTLFDVGLGEDLSRDVTHILEPKIDSRKIAKGDHLTIALDAETADDRSSDVVTVRAVRLNHQGKDFFAFYFALDESGGYYDENGRSLEGIFLDSPVSTGRITSRFAKARLHPVSGKYARHPGIDYAAPTGTPIVSIADGVVKEARNHRTKGKFVRLSHSGGYETEYLHMSRFEPGIKRGISVRRGQTIGYVGRTGIATGPHVELRLKKSGRYIDMSSEKFLQASLLPAPFLDCFQQRAEILKERLESEGDQKAWDFVFYCGLEKEHG